MTFPQVKGLSITGLSVRFKNSPTLLALGSLTSALAHKVVNSFSVRSLVQHFAPALFVIVAPVKGLEQVFARDV